MIVRLSRITIIFVYFFVLTGLSTAETKEPLIYSKTVNHFAFSLYQRLAKPGENMFFSPYSLSTALAMCYGGAEGNTKDQMSKTLFYPQSKQDTGELFKEIEKSIYEIKKRGDIELHTANDVWLQKSFEVIPSFSQYLSDFFQTQFTSLDFANNEPQARETINKRVSEVTKGRIPNIITQGIIKPLTRLILTNAIYFKGSWATPFSSKKTTAENFYTSNTMPTTVQLMSKKEEVPYYEDDKFQAIRLDYKGADVGMIVILPQKHLKLEEIEPSLDPTLISNFSSYANIQTVNIRLPRFTNRSSLELKQELSALGMSDAFSDNANFTSITHKGPMQISNVIHQAFVDVNEEGTEAAAASAVVMHIKSLPVPKPAKEFRADRPFFYAIVDNRNGMILFVGRLTNPDS